MTTKHNNTLAKSAYKELVKPGSYGIERRTCLRLVLALKLVLDLAEHGAESVLLLLFDRGAPIGQLRRYRRHQRQQLQNIQSDVSSTQRRAMKGDGYD